jgi:hypothetical protein
MGLMEEQPETCLVEATLAILPIGQRRRFERLDQRAVILPLFRKRNSVDAIFIMEVVLEDHLLQKLSSEGLVIWHLRFQIVRYKYLVVEGWYAGIELSFIWNP